MTQVKSKITKKHEYRIISLWLLTEVIRIKLEDEINWQAALLKKKGDDISTQEKVQDLFFQMTLDQLDDAQEKVIAAFDSYLFYLSNYVTFSMIKQYEGDKAIKHITPPPTLA